MTYTEYQNMYQEKEDLSETKRLIVQARELLEKADKISKKNGFYEDEVQDTENGTDYYLNILDNLPEILLDLEDMENILQNKKIQTSFNIKL